MAIRTIMYTVESEGITPKTEQFGGLQGENNVTEIEFMIEDGLFDKLDEYTGTILYRIQATDGAGGFFSSELLTLNSEQKTLTFPLSSDITNAGGVAYLHLIISNLLNDAEENILYSFPAKIRFIDTSMDGEPESIYKQGISGALAAAIKAAESAAIDAEMAESSAELAENAQAAAEDAQAAAEASASAAESAKNEAESAAEAAGNAQTAAENAKTSAANSASAAETAKQQAESAKASALQSASTAQTAAGTAAEAAETAGAAAETAEAAAETAVEAAQNVELKANLELTPIDGPFYNGDGWANGIYTVASFVNDSPAAGYTEIKFTPAVNGLVYYNPGETPAALKAGVKVYHKDTGTTRTSLSIIKDVADKANPEVVPDADMGINETPSLMENPDDTGIYELVSYSASLGTMKAYSCIFNPALSCAIGCDAEPIPGTRYYVVCGTNSDGYPIYDFSRIKDVADKQDILSDDVMSSIAEIPNKANLEFRELTPPTYGGGNEYPNGYYTITLKPDSPGPGYTEVAFTPSVAAIIYYGPNTAVPAGLDTGSTVYVESSSSGFSAFSVVKDVKDKADIEYVNNNFSDVILERSDSTAGETVVVDCCLINQYPVSSIIVGAKITYTENSISIPKNPVMHFGPYNPTDDETDNIQTITVETELCRIESTADTYDLISKKLTKQIKSADIELSEATTSITLGNGGNVPNAIALPDLPAYFVSLSDSDTITFVEKVTPSPGTTTYTLTQPIQTGYVIYVTSNPEVSTLNTDSFQLITSDKCEFYADGTTSSGGSAVFDSYIETKKSANLYLKKIMQLIGGGTDLPVYSGSYTVTPKTTAQSMKTSDKVMTDNVTIKEIPYSEVSNPQSGKTVIIGGTEIDN